MKLGNVLSRGTLKPPVTAVNSGLWGRPRHLPLHSPSPEFAFRWVSGWEGTTCCGMGHRALSRRLLQNLFKRLSAHVALTSSRSTPSRGVQPSQLWLTTRWSSFDMLGPHWPFCRAVSVSQPRHRQPACAHALLLPGTFSFPQLGCPSFFTSQLGAALLDTTTPR